MSLSQPSGEFPDPALPEFNVQLLTKGTVNIDVMYGGTKFDTLATPGSIFVAPPDTQTNYVISGAHKVVGLAINQQLLKRFRDQSEFQLPSDFGSLHEKKIYDPTIEALILRMVEQAMLQNPASDLFLDNATNTILAELLTRSDIEAGTSDEQGPLSSADLQKVTAMIENRLEEGLTIADLAGMTSLSDWHFARAFKISTGFSPHQYVLRRRIVRAKDLLTNSKLPLAEVAAATGFSSQSHMSDVFRQKVGTTPGKYRQETV
ncbi:MAG: AraC family transcriptional regulator [Pseudomonadota bacterium]